MAEYIKCSDLNDIIEWDNDIGKWVMRDSDLEALPAADVAPVVHGRWERYADKKFVGYDANGRLKYRKVYKYECSACLCETAIKSNYCPNCGAHMKDGGACEG